MANEQVCATQAAARDVGNAQRSAGLFGCNPHCGFFRRQRMQADFEILKLLDLVQRKELTLDDAMKRMPE